MTGIGKEFMEKTKYRYLGESDQSKGAKQPPVEREYDASKGLINLPDPRAFREKGTSLREAVENRKSLRTYSEEALSLEELSFLLWCTQGVKEMVQKGTVNRTSRTVPSAGARHAFETFLLINRVDGVKPGLYRFLPIEHKLVEVDMDENIADKVTEACLGQAFVKKSAVTFIWSAVVYRMAWRYGERSYRYLHLDAGHVCQNLYLSAEALNCGVCAIAAYEDDEINQLLKIDGVEEFVIYLATVGKK